MTLAPSLTFDSRIMLPRNTMPVLNWSITAKLALAWASWVVVHGLMPALARVNGPES